VEALLGSRTLLACQREKQPVSRWRSSKTKEKKKLYEKRESSTERNYTKVLRAYQDAMTRGVYAVT